MDGTMGGGFDYRLASSVLHDAAGVEAIFSEYEPLLSSLGGRRVPGKAEVGWAGPAKGAPVFFVLTGGTEGIVLDSLGPAPGRAWPVVLIAHPKHNSLPAALEIAARLRQDGDRPILVLLRGPEDEAGKAALRSALETLRLAEGMRATRIGAIGAPSDWLVASSQKAEDLAGIWGLSMESAGLDELRAEMDSAGSAGKEIGQAFLAGARFVREASGSDLDNSLAIYAALKALALRRGWNALSLRCFDLVLGEKATGCFALSQLADEGLDSGCEGDVASIVALRFMRLLSGKPGWMANPADLSFSGGKGRLLLAHCTVPRSLVAGYGVRSHFESGLGVAVAGSLPEGPVTLLRLGGKRLERAFIAEGEILPTEPEEGLCRTQALVELGEADLRRLVAKPLGNHLVLGLGRRGDAARRFAAAAGIEEV